MEQQQAQPAAAGLGAELSDAALVGLYRDGGGDFAFGELIRRHQIGLFRLLLTLLGDPDEAERLCEQTFFDAARKLDELADPAAFYPFVAGLARERAQKREEERKKSRVTSPPRPRPPPRNPREAVKQEVQGVLSELDNDERVALVLAHLEGDSYESIGATLGTSASEVEALLGRAEQKFVGAMTQRSDLPDRPLTSASTAEGELPLGTLLGQRFQLESELGKGGMGKVFRAKDLETGRDVAVKTLLPEAAKDAALRKRFEREAEIIEKLAHPNFVRFIGHGGGKTEPAYVVMEFVDGKALDRLLQLESRLAPRRALHIARHVLTGLTWAHENGVVHRDIKPENVVLVVEKDDPDFAKILDLGIARLVTSRDEVEKTRLTQKGEIFGTPVYMSPEQVQGEDVDGRSDLYSLSVMLFELIAARPPFQAKNSMALFAMHLATPPPRLSEVAPELSVPNALETLLERGLAKNPAERLPSAKEYLQNVQALLATDWQQAEAVPLEVPATPARPAQVAAKPAPIAARASPSVARSPATRSRLRTRLRPLPLALALLVIGVVIWGLLRGFHRIGG